MQDCGVGTVVGGGGSGLGGGGGGVFHELQPLPPQDVLRCPLCSIETASKEELDQHMRGHLVGLGEPGRAQQAAMSSEW